MKLFKQFLFLLALFFISLFLLGCAESGSGGGEYVSEDAITPEETDLEDREPVVQFTFNLDDSNGCSFDSSGYNKFAIPHVFTIGIELSNYLALNFTGEISIWTKGLHLDGYFAPGYKLLDITQIYPVVLTNPITLIYNGLLGNHSLISGQEYYIVIERPEAFRLNTGCEGGILPFGRKLASKNGGADWIGHNNITPWYRKSGVIMYGTD